LRSLQQPQDQPQQQASGMGPATSGMSSPFGRFQPQPSAADESPSQQPSGSFASPFGMMRSNMPAAPAQPKPDDTQPRDTFQTGQSSLTQPLHSLYGQSQQRQRDRFGYGA
jgi:hypothetical protein